MEIDFRNGQISQKNLSTHLRKLEKELVILRTVVKANDFSDLRSSINLCSNKKYIAEVKKVINQKKKLNIDTLVVCGMGGSNLGTIAIQEALVGKHYNLSNPKTKIFFADTVDSDNIRSILAHVTNSLKNGKKVLLNCVTKSGTTTETLANFHVFLNTLKKYRKDFHKYVVITTDNNSKMWDFGQKNDFTCLEIPKKVGGRYSVLSAVGLFPLGIIGVNINDLLEGAKQMRTKCLAKTGIAAKSAASTYLHYKHKKNIHDLFIFSTDCESIGKWYRQLMGESIGKQYVGITPTVSIGSTDLHSVVQLYLGGPYDKFTTFVKVIDKKSLKVPKLRGTPVTAIEGKTYSEIMCAILKGTKIAFKKDTRPFIEITLEKTAKDIGTLLQFYMIQMMLLGSLLNVNAFDQPAVEKYKKETRKLLGK